ncbi:MAG: hypothetical protein IJS08_16405 [Victivallales bacterium]|nr:hypothetical protein [Victivallales bacterium]
MHGDFYGRFKVDYLGVGIAKHFFHCYASIMHGTKLFHSYLDTLCGIATSEALKTGKIYLYVKDRPTASDEADTVMFAAIIFQGEAQHALFVLHTLASLENIREQHICASADTGLRIEVYALRQRPENPLFQTTNESILEIDVPMLVDIRKAAIKAVSHGVHHFRYVFSNIFEFRSGDAGNLDFVSVALTSEVLKKIATNV